MMNKIVKIYNWISNYISKPIQTVVYIIIGVSFLVSIPLMVKNCNKKPDYNASDAYFINENVELHDGEYLLKVISTETVNNISVYDNNKKAYIEKDGRYLAVTLTIDKIKETELKRLDVNDFKLKDHTGVYLPVQEIAMLIDVSVPQTYYKCSRDIIQSDVKFTTRSAIKDYWVGKPIEDFDEERITIYFKAPEGYKTDDIIMILEVDFYVGSGEKQTGADIILFERPKSNE